MGIVDTILVALAREAKIATTAARASASNVAIEITGMGPVRARIGAQRQLAAGATSLLSVGFAGALRAPRDVGDLLLPDEVADAFGHRYTVDAGLHRDLSRALSAQFRLCRGTLASVDHVVSDVARKNTLAAALDADAVDMESAAIARVARDARVPFAALRVVCDGPGQRIPACLDGAVDAYGHVIIARLGVGLALRPWQFLELIRLGVSTANAGRVLERALRSVLVECRC
ncbi:MAG: adenosylhomocysteine nucleosidase [Gammaproteobacteria bacterium]